MCPWCSKWAVFTFSFHFTELLYFLPPLPLFPSSSFPFFFYFTDFLFPPSVLWAHAPPACYSFMAGPALSLPLIRSGIMVWIRWWRGMPVPLTMVAISSHRFKVMCLMPPPPPPPHTSPSRWLCIITQLQEEWQTQLISCLLAVHYKGVKQDFFSSAVNTQNSALSITS